MADELDSIMSDQFRVRLEPPTDGRLPVFLSRKDDSLYFIASHIPDDPLGDLVKALITIKSLDTVHASVQWNTDPVEYEFRFDGNAVEATLTTLQWPTQRQLLEKGQTVFTVHGSREEVVLLFWRALRLLEDHSSERWDWNFPFPASDMHKLDELVGDAEQGRRAECTG